MRRLPAISPAAWFGVCLGAILGFALITRLWRLDFTEQYLFDEVYHSVTAKLIAHNDPRAFEWWNDPIEPNTAVDWLHPPLAKYTQALGMRVFGEHAFGWRISAVIFGVLMIAATAKLAQVAFNDHRVTVLAAGLAALDGLLLVQSRIAMNDIHVTFCILLLYIAYLQYRQRKISLFVVGLIGGLAIGSKWSGMFGLVFVGLVYGLEQLKTAWQQRAPLPLIPAAVKGVIFLVLLPITIYLFSYWQMFAQGKTLICAGQTIVQGECYCRNDHSWWVNSLERWLPSDSGLAQYFIARLPTADPDAPAAKTWGDLESRGGCARLISHFWELHHQIWWYQTTLVATHNYQSRPLQWFLNTKPVWMFVEYPSDGGETIGNVYAQGNPLLFWGGDVAVLFTGLVVGWQWWMWFVNTRVAPAPKKVRSHLHPPAYALTFLFAGYLVLWLPWQLSPRIMFFYHYTPAVPLLCILLAYWLRQCWGSAKLSHGQYGSEYVIRRGLVVLFIVLTVSTFVVFYPNWTGIQVPKWIVEQVYFSLPSWR